MPEPNEIISMMSFFKEEDNDSVETLQIESINNDYVIDDSIFDEPVISDMEASAVNQNERRMYNRIDNQHDNQPDNLMDNQFNNQINYHTDNQFENQPYNKPDNMSDNQYYMEGISHNAHSSKPRIRFLNACPGTKYDIVCLYDNNQKETLSRNLGYARMSDYKPVRVGLFKMYIYIAGSRNSLLSFHIEIPRNGYYTLMLCGSFHNIKPLLSFDIMRPATAEKASVRLIQLSPLKDDSGFLLNSNLLFNGLKEATITEYKDIEPGIYNFKLISSSTNKVLLTASNIKLQPNKVYTVFVLGFQSGHPRLSFSMSVDDGDELR